MYTFGYSTFRQAEQLVCRLARQANHTGAHYDLGSSGHGITTDCKDALGGLLHGRDPAGGISGWRYSF